MEEWTFYQNVSDLIKWNVKKTKRSSSAIGRKTRKDVFVRNKELKAFLFFFGQKSCLTESTDQWRHLFCVCFSFLNKVEAGAEVSPQLILYNIKNKKLSVAIFFHKYDESGQILSWNEERRLKLVQQTSRVCFAASFVPPRTHIFFFTFYFLLFKD